MCRNERHRLRSPSFGETSLTEAGRAMCVCGPRSPPGTRSALLSRADLSSIILLQRWVNPRARQCVCNCLPRGHANPEKEGRWIILHQTYLGLC